MQFKHDVIDLITKRKSHRTFQKYILDANVLYQIVLEIQELSAGLKPYRGVDS